MDDLRVGYSTFISLSESKNLPIQYTQKDSTYWLVLSEGDIVWSTFLVYGTADYIDFETNYKPTANRPVVQTVSIPSLPLPENAAKETDGNLDSINAGLQTLNSLIPSVYDYISLGYTGNNLTTAIFKHGGASGTVISTLTLVYSGDNLISVAKS